MDGMDEKVIAVTADIMGSSSGGGMDSGVEGGLDAWHQEMLVLTRSMSSSLKEMAKVSSKSGFFSGGGSGGGLSDLMGGGAEAGAGVGAGVVGAVAVAALGAIVGSMSSLQEGFDRLDTAVAHSKQVQEDFYKSDTWTTYKGDMTNNQNAKEKGDIISKEPTALNSEAVQKKINAIIKENVDDYTKYKELVELSTEVESRKSEILKADAESSGLILTNNKELSDESATLTDFMLKINQLRMQYLQASKDSLTTTKDEVTAANALANALERANKAKSKSGGYVGSAGTFSSGGNTYSTSDKGLQTFTSGGTTYGIGIRTVK